VLAQPKTPANPADVTAERFASAVTALSRSSPRLGTALKNGRLRGTSAGKITLAYPPGDFRGAQLSSDRAEVEGLLAQELGGWVSLTVVEGIQPGDAESLAEVESRGDSAKAERARETARSSAAVRDAVRILGGTVEEIRLPSERKEG
jgi:hypothetical protein